MLHVKNHVKIKTCIICEKPFEKSCVKRSDVKKIDLEIKIYALHVKCLKTMCKFPM